MYQNMLSVMGVKYLARNSRDRSVRVSWLVEAENRERFNALARNNGVSASAMLDKVIERIASEADENDQLDWLQEAFKGETLTRNVA